MRIVAINGSPRKNKNTATLLKKVLKGAADAVAPETIETELVNLYDLTYTGCRSCFACKLKGGSSYGKCAIKDDLYPVLEKLADADAVVFGSPIYYRTITGQLHAFYERFLYPYMTYKKGYPTLVTNKMKTACIYTMNVTEEEMLDGGYRKNMELFETFIEMYFTKPELLFSFNTTQFNDYSRYVCETFSAEEKAIYKAEHFPADCERAYELGKQLIK